MARLLEEVPVERMVVPPLALLPEFAAHEQQFLAGMSEHKAEVGAQIGEALPVVARHAAEDRTLAVHDLIMRQRKDEILGEGVVQSERDLSMLMLAVDRVLADVIQRVVHPAHIPFVTETDTADVDASP